MQIFRIILITLFRHFINTNLSKFITYLSEYGDVLGDLGLTHLFPLNIRDVEVPSLLDDIFSGVVVSPSTLDFSISEK